MNINNLDKNNIITDHNLHEYKNIVYENINVIELENILLEINLKSDIDAHNFYLPSLEDTVRFPLSSTHSTTSNTR